MPYKITIVKGTKALIQFEESTAAHAAPNFFNGADLKGSKIKVVIAGKTPGHGAPVVCTFTFATQCLCLTPPPSVAPPSVSPNCWHPPGLHTAVHGRGGRGGGGGRGGYGGGGRGGYGGGRGGGGGGYGRY